MEDSQGAVVHFCETLEQLLVELFRIDVNGSQDMNELLKNDPIQLPPSSPVLLPAPVATPIRSHSTSPAAIPHASSEDSFLSEPPEGLDDEDVALPLHLSLGMMVSRS
jgi:hypothetical protein